MRTYWDWYNFGVGANSFALSTNMKAKGRMNSPLLRRSNLFMLNSYKLDYVTVNYQSAAIAHVRSSQIERTRQSPMQK
jgi:hypothetical protein